MPDNEDEEEQLRSAALQNANSIFILRQQAEQEIVEAKEALEQKTEELARSLSMMRATLESTTDGILVTDHAGKVTGFNEKFVQMWQVPREVLNAREHHRLIDVTARRFRDAQPIRARIKEIYETAPEETFDILELADGLIFERFSKIQRIDHRNAGRVWSFRDITERKHAEAERERLLASEREARERAERETRMKDEFLATLSHELRTPLNAVLGWANILRTSENFHDISEGLEVIERNARAQAEIIEDLLDMSRIVSGKVRLEVEALDLLLLIKSAVESVAPMAAAKNIELATELDPRAGNVSGDPARLQQVLWNLLSNAVKFTPKNGRVWIALARANSNVEIRVRDSGKGIASDFLPHVFDRFRQADASTTRMHGGLGLGLAIVKNLVELHGGQVRAESAGESEGATFTVVLPLAAQKIGNESEPNPPRAIRETGKTNGSTDLNDVRVLVVDDELDARQLVRRILSERGAGVEIVATSSELLELLPRVRPHVLIADIGMPGEDGYDVIRKVRALSIEQGGAVPAIALTAFARAEDRERAIASGFQLHMTKPVEAAELIASVANLAGRSAATNAQAEFDIH